jgi:uncharacterized protein YukE
VTVQGRRWRHIRGIALAALVIAPGPQGATAGEASAQLVAIRHHDGRCDVRQLSPEALSALQARLEGARQDLSALAHRLASDAAGAQLAPAREGVPAFSAWAYSWVQSYVSALEMIGSLAASLVEVLRAGEGAGAGGSLERMAEPMRRAFEARVLRRDDVFAALRADLTVAGALIDLRWRAAIDDGAAVLATAPVAVAEGAPPRLDLVALAAPVAAEVVAVAFAPESTASAAPGADPASVVLHSMRPLAARIGALGLRMTEIGSLLAAGSVLGFGVGGWLGLAIGGLGAVAVYWILDWLFSRVDAALNQEDFEAQALAAIDATERAAADRMRDATRDVLGRRLGELMAEQGCQGSRP